MAFNFTNFTPHDVTVVGENGFTIKASGETIRLGVDTTTPDGLPDWVKVRKIDCKIEVHDDHTVIGGVRIPDGADIIVSAQVASFLATKGDLPFNIFTVGDTIKDSNGAIIGTKFLVLN